MTLSGYQYICSAGESFDSVALILYGHEKYAAELLSVNVTLAHKLIFDGGEILILPEIDVPEDEETGSVIPTAPWKE